MRSTHRREAIGSQIRAKVGGSSGHYIPVAANGIQEGEARGGEELGEQGSVEQDSEAHDACADEEHAPAE